MRASLFSGLYFKGLLILFSGFFSLSVSAQQPSSSLNAIISDLAQDIESAQNSLSIIEESLSKERGELSRQINSVQNQVLDLRESAVAARRLADEETLSLSQIETRLEGWQEQSQFQSRLLAGFLSRIGKRSFSNSGEVNLQVDLQTFAQHLDEQEAGLYPSWEQERLVLSNGELSEAMVLNLGPVTWFHQENTGADNTLSGLAARQGDLLSVKAAFDSALGEGIASLYQSGSGLITFDPTLSRALLLAEDKETLVEHLQKGGIWVIPILLFALFATLIAGFKSIALMRLPALMPALAERVEKAAKDGPEALKSVLRKVQGSQAVLLKIALNPQTAEQRDDRLYAALLEQRNKLERWLGAIAITAAVSPLLGLLGTVSGMIATFKLMTLFGAGDANSVSAGISEALVTTELGLVVAIPALLAHALMSRKVKSYFSLLENDAVHLSQLPLTSNSHNE